MTGGLPQGGGLASALASHDTSRSTAAVPDESRAPGADASATAGGTRQLLPGGRACAWCAGPIPDQARRDAVCCSKRCRQARHRFASTVGRSAVPVAGDRVLRLAYAEPPYPGKARLYRDHPDYAGEVDHAGLIRRLCTTAEPLHTLHTLHTRQSAALVRPAIEVEDCRFRLLQPREHLRAQRFPDTYVVTGNKGEQTCQAGNAVSANVAQWLGRQIADVLDGSAA